MPNFGADKDEVLLTADSIANTESKMGKKFQATFSQPVAPPRDYFVPNFGADHDISMTGLNLAESEEQHGHKLVAEEPAKEIPRNYFIPNFGKDKEIIAT